MEVFFCGVRGGLVLVWVGVGDFSGEGGGGFSVLMVEVVVVMEVLVEEVVVVLV